MKQCRGQMSMFSAEASLDPASRSALPGSEEARRMTVTSGLKCLELYRNSGPLGSLVRTLLESSIWRSTRCTLIWKTKVTPSKRLLFRLVPSTRRTGGTEYVSWAGNDQRAIYFIPTPRAQNIKTSEKAKRESKSSPGLADYIQMFPTPTRFDATCGDLAGKEYTGTRHAMKLIQAAKLWRTPAASDSEGRGTYATYDAYKERLNKGKQISLANQVKFPELWPTPTTGAGMCGGTGNYQQLKRLEESGQITPEERRSMAAGNGGQLNPDWVEWLMGLPVGWTEA